MSTLNTLNLTPIATTLETPVYLTFESLNGEMVNFAVSERTQIFGSDLPGFGIDDEAFVEFDTYSFQNKSSVFVNQSEDFDTSKIAKLSIQSDSVIDMNLRNFDYVDIDVSDTVGVETSGLYNGNQILLENISNASVHSGSADDVFNVLNLRDASAHYILETGAGDDDITIETIGQTQTEISAGSGNDYVHVGSYNSEATTKISFGINLDAQTQPGSGIAFSRSVSLFGVDGQRHELVLKWKATDLFEWELSFDQPVAVSDDGTVLGTGQILSLPKTFTFNGDGTLATIDGEDKDSFTLEFFAVNAEGFISSVNPVEFDFSKLLQFAGSFDVFSIESERASDVIELSEHQIKAGKGDDSIYITSNGHTEATVHAGKGDDYIDVRPQPNGETPYIHEKLIAYGGRGDDQIIGSRGDDMLYGGKDNDFLAGGLGNDQIFGGRGDDLLQDLSGSNILRGGLGNDQLRVDTSEGDNQVYGGRDNDILIGGLGDDALYGGRGNDDIRGNSGDNMIVGGKGADLLVSGDGADQFVWNRGDIDGSLDRIDEFDASEGDVIDLSNVLFRFDPLDDAISDFLQLTEVDGSTVIAVDKNGGGDNFTDIAFIANTTDLGSAEDLVDNGSIVV